MVHFNEKMEDNTPDWLREGEIQLAEANEQIRQLQDGQIPVIPLQAEPPKRGRTLIDPNQPKRITKPDPLVHQECENPSRRGFLSLGTIALMLSTIATGTSAGISALADTGETNRKKRDIQRASDGIRNLVLLPAMAISAVARMQKVNRRKFFKWCKRGAIAGGVGALGGWMTGKAYGEGYLKEALAVAKQKHPIAFKVLDPDLVAAGKDTIGYEYGTKVGTRKELAGDDKSIPVHPDELKEDGHLYWWYQALMAIEDKGHEGGMSDVLGIDPMALARSVVFMGKRGSGSGISDQACHAMMDGDDDYDRLSRVYKMLRDKACGIEAGTRMEPREVAAHYASAGRTGLGTAGVETFSQIYWGFNQGTQDEQMTLGHQIILASLMRYTWIGSQKGGWEKRWKDIKKRSRIAIIRLLNSPDTCSHLIADLGLNEVDIDSRKNHWKLALEELEKDPGLKESLQKNGIYDYIDENGITEPDDKKFLARQYMAYKKLMAQVEKAKPDTRDELKKDAPDRLVMTPTPNYAPPIRMAIQEAENLFGANWREIVESITLTIDPNVQRTTAESAKSALNKVRENARAAVLAVNSEGAIIGAYSGDKKGFDFDRFNSKRSPGSLGKTLLALGLGARGYKTTNPALSEFIYHLKRSNIGAADATKELGIDPAYLLELMECYGTVHEDRGGDPVLDATMGQYSATPKDLARMMLNPQTTTTTGHIHVVHEFHLRNGRTVSGDLPVIPILRAAYVGLQPNITAIEKEAKVSEARNNCHVKVLQNNTFFKEAMTAPLDPQHGTLRVAHGVADLGKTGTVGEHGGATNMALAAGTAATREEIYAVVAIIGADKSHESGRMVDINTSPRNKASGGKTAGPIVRDVLSTIKTRATAGRLQ